MTLCRLLLQGLLLSVALGCNALPGWSRNSVGAAVKPHHALAWTSRTQQQRWAPRTLGRQLPVAAAVASTSHLTTGRTASGVLENCLEACLTTMQSFVGGTIMGCVIGGVMGGSFGRVPDVGWLKSVQTKAVEMGGNWGQLSAAFTGFTSISTVMRGRNDKWDQVLGACGAGAFLNRAKGVQGMAQGAATYGLFSLIFAFPSAQDDELDVVDIPVDAPKTR
ncbi:unnamed protein product [Ectocarpus fasciculatus]